MIRIRFRDIEVEAQTADQLDRAIEKLQKLADIDAANRPKVPSGTIAAAAGVSIPADNERLRRTKAELARDEERVREGLQPYTREEIIAQRKANQFPATGEKFEGVISLEDVPE